MTVLEWLAVIVAAMGAVLALGVGALFLRRLFVQRDGGFDMCLRTGRDDGWSGGWVFGIARYRGDMLEWFRTFGAGGSKRVLGRRALVVHSRREPELDEAYDLPAGHLIFICDIDGEQLEVSMTEAASMAFLSWLEAAPPGEHLVA
jgi:hypothetical protein